LAEKNISLQAKIEADKKKVEYTEHILKANTPSDISVLAKLLDESPHSVYRWFRDNGYCYYRKVDGNNYTVPYQASIDSGLMLLHETRYRDKHNNLRTSYKTLITAKGKLQFVEKIKESKIAASKALERRRRIEDREDVKLRNTEV